MARAAVATDWGNFTPLATEIQPCLIMRSWGWDKCGKTHFGLTMPGPILGMYLDPAGTTGVAEKFMDGTLAKKEIRGIQYRFNKKTMDQEAAIEIKAQWLEDYRHALGVARSIQWDETETWELFRFAEFGRESARGREYGPLNGEYRGLIQDAFDAGVNLQLVQKVKEKWEDDKPTGLMAPQGFQQAGNIVQVSLEHRYDEEEKVFKTRIANCRQNTEIWGQEYDNLTFPDLGQLVYPHTNEEDWI